MVNLHIIILRNILKDVLGKSVFLGIEMETAQQSVNEIELG